MKPLPNLDRRQFVTLGTLAATAAMLPNSSRAAETGDSLVPAVPMPLTLPQLPYAFDALEPHIDAKTMEIHHGKHHAAYIKNFNTAVATSPGILKQALDQILANLPEIPDEALRNTLRNNGGGHWNHDFFWKTLSPPEKSRKPSDLLAASLQASFGSLDDFKKAFGEAATKRFGSGWAWLVVKDGKLKITSTQNQDNPAMKGIVPDADLGAPILALDVWEHAYYLHYQNRRPEYISAWWNVVNWQVVSERYARATA